MYYAHYMVAVPAALLLPLSLGFVATSVWLAPTPQPSPLRTGTPSMSVTALNDLKVYELKAVCRAKGLKVSGRKAELVERIMSASVGAAAPPAAKAVKGRGKKATTPPAASPPAAADAPPPFAADPPPPSAASPIATGPVTELRSADASATAGEPEVLSGEEGDLQELRAAQKAKRAARRAKLAGYFSEEYAKTVGSLESAAGEPYAHAIGMPAIETVLIGGGVSIEMELPQLPPGHQLAWCKAYDRNAGRGTLVDLLTKQEWPVLAADLAAPLETAALNVGEFVEYLPASAVQAQQSASAGEAAAAAGPAAAERPTGWVRGLMGWPLMCQAVSQEVDAVLAR